MDIQIQIFMKDVRKKVLFFYSRCFFNICTYICLQIYNIVMVV